MNHLDDIILGGLGLLVLIGIFFTVARKPITPKPTKVVVTMKPTPTPTNMPLYRPVSAPASIQPTSAPQQSQQPQTVNNTTVNNPPPQSQPNPTPNPLPFIPILPSIPPLITLAIKYLRG